MRGVPYIVTFAALALAAPVNAATITVNEGDDNSTGPGCELREAVASANTNTTVGGCPTAGTAGTDSINFSVTTPATIVLASTITVTSGEPLIIDGPTANPADLVIGQTPANSRIFTANADLTLLDVSLEDGNSGNPGGAVAATGTLTLANTHFENNNAAGSAASGGCVFGNVVTVTGSSFTGNSATGGGGCIYARTITLDSSTFTGNSATGFHGGAVSADDSLTVTDTNFGGPTPADANTAAVLGGAIASGTLTVDGSTFSGNGALQGGAISTESGLASITDSTFTANDAPSGGGAVSASEATLNVLRSSFIQNSASDGGAIRLTGSGGSLVNSTFQGNSASGDGGSVWSSLGSEALLLHDTFADNPSPTGDVAGEGLTLEKSIVADTGAPTQGTNCAGAIVDGGRNVIFGDEAGSTCPTAGTNVTGDPALSPPGAFGGPTPTMLPGPGSVAVDLIPNVSCTANQDQRGANRPVPPGGACDAGAVEVDFLPDALIARGQGEFAGNGVYSDEGAGQTKAARVRRGKVGTFVMRVENDAQLLSDEFEITGPGGNEKFAVKYFSDAINITSEVIGDGYDTGALAPGASSDPIAVKVRVKKDTRPNRKISLPLTATSSGFPGRADTVKVVVTAK